jgi:hypothetical protein
MKTNKSGTFTLIVPGLERRVYEKARGILVRKMKTAAPGLGELILHELQFREPRDIADEYLDYARSVPGVRIAGRRAVRRKPYEKKVVPVCQDDRLAA